MGAQLAVEDEAAVRDAIAALEVAEGVVPAAAFPALQDPALRSAVTHRLGACGRVLISVGPGWVSGYDDEVADTLGELGIGLLSPTDRAVLALVLLRTVAIPRARGELSGNAWVTPDGARPTTVAELNHNRHLTKRQKLSRCGTCGRWGCSSRVTAAGSSQVRPCTGCPGNARRGCGRTC